MKTLKKKEYKTTFHGQDLALEFSDLAGQATSSAVGRYGESSVLVTVVMGEKEKAGDFFPLTVDYEERFYAVGKILGSRFMRREGRPSEEAVLSGRIIDRTIRPLFNQRLRNEVQVVVTILEWDGENDLDFITLLTASAALATSKLPWAGPVAGVKMFFDGQKLTFNPKLSALQDWQKEKSFLSFVSGPKDKINMIELEGIDADEAAVASAYAAAQKEINHLVEWQEKIVQEIGQPKVSLHLADSEESLIKMIRAFIVDKIEAAVFTKDKKERAQKMGEMRDSLMGHLVTEGIEERGLSAAEYILESEIDALVHKKALESGQRPDGRKLDEVRPLGGEVALFKRTHGSALFMRGETHALAVTTLAAPGSEQLIESLEFSGKRRFMLHYNFPHYSVGEIGKMGNTGRREIGHGALAEKAVRNIIPKQEEFPYIIRVVSEVLSSNGSSSMATVCGASLSLMDAGVPIKKAVAGIAMGLMSDEKGNYKVLTDIQGPEDHYGDMDFKVAGTSDGIRAVQLDTKIAGLNNKMITDTLGQAQKARMDILKVMNSILAAPRAELSTFAPVILTLNIDPEKIGEVIGPGGKIINSIIEKTGIITMDIEQDGKVFIAGPNRESAQMAYEIVESIAKDYKVGDIVEGEVVRIMDFGAIVEFGPGRDGMIHVSELKNGFVKKVEDVVQLGDVVRAKVIRVEDGRIGLSIKALQEKGE